jgi:hypothetical protein
VTLAAALTLALAVGQGPPFERTPVDEDPIPGLPGGDPAPHPSQVVWNPAETTTHATSARGKLYRQRITFEGKWRFAALSTKEERLLRSEMGWIDMPAPGDLTKASLYNPNLEPAEGKFKGKNVKDLPWVVVEREIATPLGWTDNRIYLVIRGPWSKAEVYSFGVPVEGIERGNAKWFSLTEDLSYGGIVDLTMRMEWPKDAAGTENPPEPYIGLELTPIAAWIEDMIPRKDSKTGELEFELHLRRAKFFLNPDFRINEIDLGIETRLEDAETEVEIYRGMAEIGKMPEETRVVKIRVPWSKEKGQAPPKRIRISQRVIRLKDIIFDVAIPTFEDLDKLEEVGNSGG